jgi:hypothetical protein
LFLTLLGMWQPTVTTCCLTFSATWRPAMATCCLTLAWVCWQMLGGCPQYNPCWQRQRG